MNCDEVKARLGAEPGSSDPELSAHAASCARCAEYQRQLQAMDGLIRRALEVPVTRAAPRRKPLAWRIAASALLAVTVALGSVWLLQPRDSFAAEVIEHVHHESYAIVQTSSSVPPQKLADVMSKAGVTLKPGAMHVSYASPCVFRGQVAPHLVVQTDAGPVTVLVMPTHPRPDRPQRIEEEGYEGTIMPAPRGMVVVVGRGVPVDAAAARVIAALDYESDSGPAW